jgi:CubicO group peptidase (beta-lactamase class C family)
MKKIRQASTLLLLLNLIFSCEGNKKIDFELNQKLSGCWVGGLLKNGQLTEDIQLRYIKLKPDSTIATTLIYELGPRSRVWEYDTEINCQNRKISWIAHNGLLSENMDTIYVTKNWKGDVSEWMFFRDPAYDEFIRQFLLNKTKDYNYAVPERNNESISCASFGDVGFEPVQIFEFMKKIILGDYGDIHSVLIYRNGKLVLEEYFALNGQFSGDFINETYRNKTHQLSSVTKGILSLSTGIAIENEHINDVTDPIVNYLLDYEKYFSVDKKQIQINHLLTMTSGWDWSQFKYSWSDSRNDAANMYKCEDVVKYVVEKPLNFEPGKKFNYTNGEPTVLGVVLKNSFKMEVGTFTEKHLLNPLGIFDYQWSQYPDGTLKTDGGLKLCSRDLLKIGILVLNKGNWQGKQIISENWIEESTKSRVSLSMRRGFGYYWNKMFYDYDGKTENAIFVPGDGGQFLVIFPSLEMVIVFTAGNYSKDATKTYWSIIENSILPALK